MAPDLGREPLRQGPAVAGHQRPEPLQPVRPQRLVVIDPLRREQALDGLITNDKFCLTRAGRLRLAWSRVRVRGRAPDRAYPRGEVTHRGGAMRQRRSWRVQRTGVMAPTGQQRWDQAYQLLLRWATTDQAAPAGSPVAVSLPEMSRAHSDLRPGLDQPAGRPPDH